MAAALPQTTTNAQPPIGAEPEPQAPGDLTGVVTRGPIPDEGNTETLPQDRQQRTTRDVTQPPGAPKGQRLAQAEPNAVRTFINSEMAETLLDDAPGDDRSELGLKARTEVYNDADAMHWLFDGEAKFPEAPPKEPEEPDDPTSMVQAVRNLAEPPLQVVGGAIDGFNATLALGDEIIERLGADLDKFPKLPTTKEPKSGTGQVVRTISQFLVPFGIVGKTFKAIKEGGRVTQFLRTMAAGGVADFAAFEGHEQRVSDLIQTFPSLQNPLTEFLQGDEDDSDLEGRLKTAVEGLALGPIGDTLFRALRASKKIFRRRPKEPGVDEATAARTTQPEDVQGEAGPLDLLGSADDGAPLVSLRSDVDKLAIAARETDPVQSGVRRVPPVDVPAFARPGFPRDVTARGVAGRTANPRDFTASRLVPSESDTVSENTLFRAFEEWAQRTGQTPISKAEFSKFITDQGIQKGRIAGRARFIGVKFRNPSSFGTPIKGKDDLFINFARINEPEDIQNVINDTAQAFKSEIDTARRGVISNEITKLSAQHVDAFDTLMKRRKGAPLNAAQSFAARQLWATSGEKLGEVAEIAAATPTPENLFQFRRMLATHHAIQKEVLAARTETARALQAWAIPAGGSKERLRNLEEMLSRFGGTEAATDLARRVAVMSKGPNAPAALSHFVDKTVFEKSLGSIQEYWINALLSGPKTHMVNMMSNTGVVGLSILERSAAARFGRVFAEEGIEVGEAAAQVAGIRGGLRDAWRNAGKALRTGQTGFGLNKIELPRERYISSGAWNMRSGDWKGRAVDGLGTVVNVPGRLLQAEDEFFKTIGYRMELHAQAHRTVSREVAAGTTAKADWDKRMAEILDDPPESIRLDAAANAAYQTFTNQPGKFTKGIQRIMSDHPSLRFILPFINTPGNILKFTFERTPLAPVTERYRSAIAKGGAEADLARTRMAMGTMALMIGIDLALDGHTTGSGPNPRVNRAVSQNWRRQGRQPYSIRFGDQYFAVNRLDPLGYTVGISSDIAEFLLNANADENTAEDLERAMSAAVFAIAENVTSKSYMQGMSNLMGAIEQPERFASIFMQRFFSSFVPTGVREIATFNDPVKRSASSILTSIQRKVPWLSQGVPASRDLWGREISYQSDLSAVYDAVSPIYASGFKPEPIDSAMEKDNWYLGMGGYTFTVDGQRVPLKNRPDIRNRYYELRGGTKPSALGEFGDGLVDKYGDKSLLEVLNDMVTGNNFLSEKYEEAETPEDKRHVANRVFSQYGRAAKKKLFEEFPWIEQTAARLKRQQDQR